VLYTDVRNERDGKVGVVEFETRVGTTTHCNTIQYNTIQYNTIQ
jgi:hypothetical protein